VSLHITVHGGEGEKDIAQTHPETQLQLARRPSISCLVGWASVPLSPRTELSGTIPLAPHPKGPGADIASPLSKHIFHYGA